MGLSPQNRPKRDGGVIEKSSPSIVVSSLLLSRRVERKKLHGISALPDFEEMLIP